MYVGYPSKGMENNIPYRENSMCKRNVHTHTHSMGPTSCKSRLVELCRVSGGMARDETRELDRKQMRKLYIALLSLDFILDVIGNC